MKKKKTYQLQTSSKELIFCDDDQKYARVLTTLGDRRFQILTENGTVAAGKLRRNFRRRDIVSVNTIVLVSARFDDGKYDILIKYDDKEVRQLRKYGELTELDDEYKKHQEAEHIRLYGVSAENVDEDDIMFENDDDNIDLDDI